MKIGRRLQTFALILLSGWLPAQRISTLELKEKVSVPNVFAGILVGDIKCDASSNLYFQPYAPSRDRTGIYGNSIVKISANGEKKTRFDLSTVSGFEQAEIVDFNVGNGDIYFLASKNSEGPVYLLKFDADGKYKSLSRLEADITPRQLAAFGDGNLLIGGFVVNRENIPSNSAKQPFLGVFNERGQLLFPVSLKGDIGPQNASSASSEDNNLEPRRSYEKAIAISIMQSGQDGNVYLMRFSPQGPVFTISPSGRMLRVLKLQAPEAAKLATIKLANDRLAALFLKKKQGERGIKEAVISVYDTSTSEKVADYSYSTAEIGLGLACYTPETFTFIGGNQQGTLQIIRAVPK
jgi:hypothetical protein